jgi:hypothetical protein
MNRTTTRGQNARYQKQPVITKSPQTSIRSSQAFNNQSQMQASQPNYRTQQPQYEEENVSEQVPKKSPMTIQKAITLITLRLGAIETKLLNNPSLTSSSEYLGESLDDQDKEHIFERLNALETKTFNSNSIDYKQSIDMLTQSIAQLRTTNAAILKENKELKNSINNFKNELFSLKSNTQSMQQSISENKMKILELSLLGQSENEFNLNDENEVDTFECSNIEENFEENIQENIQENVEENKLEINLLNDSDIKF